MIVHFDDVSALHMTLLMQDIDNVALVDHQQHLRRLKQGRADDADSPPSQARRRQLQGDVDNGLPSTPWDFSKQASHGLIWSGVGAANSWLLQLLPTIDPVG